MVETRAHGSWPGVGDWRSHHRSSAHAIVDESDAYSRAVAGINISSIRIGSGSGPTHVDTLIDPRFISTTCRHGYPMASHTTIDDGRLIIARIRSAPPGGRWCSIDLEPGTVLVYGPGAEHAAINPAGLEFTFVAIETDLIEAVAEELHMPPAIPPYGQVHTMAESDGQESLRDVFSRLADAAGQESETLGSLADDTLTAIAEALVDGERDQRIGSGSRIDSRTIVSACLEFAHAVERIPTIGEMCLTAHVSERRLRQAFYDEFDMPPTRFFRAWALDLVHRRLLRADPDWHTVTHLAATAGFLHLGRFAAAHRAVYGEPPSQTLKRAVG